VFLRKPAASCRRKLIPNSGCKSSDDVDANLLGDFQLHGRNRSRGMGVVYRTPRKNHFTVSSRSSFTRWRRRLDSRKLNDFDRKPKPPGPPASLAASEHRARVSAVGLRTWHSTFTNDAVQSTDRRWGSVGSAASPVSETTTDWQPIPRMAAHCRRSSRSNRRWTARRP